VFFYVWNIGKGKRGYIRLKAYYDPKALMAEQPAMELELKE